MSRKIFWDGSRIFDKGKNESSHIEYKPPREKLVDPVLVNRLLEHYIYERDNGVLQLWQKDYFKPEIRKLESIIRNQSDKPHPKMLTDSLAVMLKDESDGITFVDYTRTMYLTIIVQALYNLDYTNEFAIDIRDWPEDEHYVGMYLQGRQNRGLILNLYGEFRSCGFEAEYCDFIIHNKVDWCGSWAENCTFNLMPDAEVKEYLGGQSRGNLLRRLNENSE